VGLPGDVESENNYREQLQAWLGLLASPSPPRKLFVLSDHSEGLILPASFPAMALPADRTNFLSLARMIPGNAAPVMVVAWGHGGKRGATPVFHVRGPRLTPADFLSVGAGFPGSRWILLFRGSGAFARQLAAAQLEILSSECDTMFASDPVGMSVLLKSLRNDPGISFEGLARKFGSATASWYAERNLARTEEPTLWLAGQKPQLLSETPNADSFQALDPGGQSKPGRGSEAESSPNPDGKAPADLPPAWSGIKPVEAQRYPHAEGVVLRQLRTCTLGSSPALTTDQDTFIQVLTWEGKSLGDFDLSYSPPDEEIELLDCEVLRPDGKLIRSDRDTVADASARPVGDYKGSQRKFFSLPGVIPGAILHVHYRTQWKEFPLPRISMALPITQELPVVDSTVHIAVPKQSPFHFAFEDLAAPDPTVRQTSYSTCYTWHLGNCPARPREVLTPPRRGARLLFSTFADWNAFAEWYERITRLTAEDTPEISAKAKELTQNVTNDEERVLALYNYVTGLRYVAVPLGVNSLRPHAAANVLRNQFGDCKDKANLFNALLQSINIEAHLVLVPRFAQAHDVVPGFAFNHAISRVTLAGQTLWVDTTDDICRFGLLPPGDPGRKVLVIDGRANTLTQLPPPSPTENWLRITGELDASGSGDCWPAKLKAVAHGYPDYQLREAERETGDDHGAVPLLASKLRPVAGSFALDNQTMTPISALQEDFAWQAEGNSIGLLCSGSGKKFVRSPFWLPMEWDLALHHRRSPLFMNQGYPITLEEEFHLRLPPNQPETGLPGGCGNDEPPLRWRIEWARVADDNLVARFHAELEKGELSWEETSVFQKQLRTLLTSLASDVVLTTAPQPEQHKSTPDQH